MKSDKGLAINFRQEGKSYNEISKILGTPKSTLSLWLRKIDMPPEIRKKFWNDVKEKQAKSITEFNKKQAEKAKKKQKKYRKMLLK